MTLMTQRPVTELGAWQSHPLVRQALRARQPAPPQQHLAPHVPVVSAFQPLVHHPVPGPQRNHLYDCGPIRSGSAYALHQPSRRDTTRPEPDRKSSDDAQSSQAGEKVPLSSSSRCSWPSAIAKNAPISLSSPDFSLALTHGNVRRLARLTLTPSCSIARST